MIITQSYFIVNLHFLFKVYKIKSFNVYKTVYIPLNRNIIFQKISIHSYASPSLYKNTMLLDELSAILTFFARKDEKAEFVKLIFLTNSA